MFSCVCVSGQVCGCFKPSVQKAQINPSAYVFRNHHVCWLVFIVCVCVCACFWQLVPAPQYQEVLAQSHHFAYAHSQSLHSLQGTRIKMALWRSCLKDLTLAFAITTSKQSSPNLSSAAIQNTPQSLFGGAMVSWQRQTTYLAVSQRGPLKMI